MFPIFKLLLFFFKKFTQFIKMSIIKRKLAGVLFENKEIKYKNNNKNRIEDIKKNIKTDFHISKLGEYKSSKKEELIEQNNNSNIDILSIHKINRRGRLIDKKLNNKNSKEYNEKNKFSLKEENRKISLNKKSLLSPSIKNNESFSFYDNFQPDTPQNNYKYFII